MKSMINDYALHFTHTALRKNSFGIVPGVYIGRIGGNNRKSWRLLVPVFPYIELEWWVGINTNIASAGNWSFW